MEARADTPESSAQGNGPLNIFSKFFHRGHPDDKPPAHSDELQFAAVLRRQSGPSIDLHRRMTERTLTNASHISDIVTLQGFLELPAWATRKDSRGRVNEGLLGSALREPSELSSWSVRQLIEKLRGTTDPHLLARYCERLHEVEKPPPQLAQEAIGIIAICMCTYIDFPPLVVAACKLFRYLCAGYDANATARKHGLASVGAIEAIMDGMRNHQESADVQLHACSAIACVCSGCDMHEDWRKQQASDYGAAEACTCALDTFPDDTQVMHTALLAITNVTGGIGASANRRKRRAVNAGAVDVIEKKVLGKFLTNSLIAHDSLTALATLYAVDYESDEQEVAAVRGGWKTLTSAFGYSELYKHKFSLIHTILKCVQAHPTDDGLQASAQRLIAHLMKMKKEKTIS